MRRDIVDKDPLLSRLKIHADTFDTPDERSGPDWPSPKVWMAVQEANRRRKKRRALWMMSFTVAGMLCGMAIWTVLFTGKPMQAQIMPPQAMAPYASVQAARTIPASPGTTDTDKAPNSFVSTAVGVISHKGSNTDRHFVRKTGYPSFIVLDSTDNTSPAETKPETLIPAKQESGIAATAPAAPQLLPMPLGARSLQKLHWNKPEVNASKVDFSLHPKPVKPIRLTLQTGLFLTALKLKTIGNAPTGQERAAWSMQYGAALSRQLTEHWTLNTGLQWSTHHITATRESNILFKTNAERFDPLQQIYTGTVRQELQTSLGAVEMRYDINRIAGQPVADQTPIRVAFQTDERVHYLRMPIYLQFETRAGQKFVWGIQGGLGVNLLMAQQFTVYQNNDNTTLLPEIRSVEARNVEQARGLTRSLVDAQMGISGQYRLGGRWRLQASLEGRHGLQSMYRNADFKSYPLALGMQAGVFWLLNP